MNEQGSDICKKYADMMFDYIENGNSDEYTELKEHLSVCEACRHELDECTKLLTEVRSSAPTPPADMKKKVMLAVSADAKLQRRKKLTKQLSAVAAALVIAVGVGVALSSGVLNSYDGEADAPQAGEDAPIGNMSNGMGQDKDEEVTGNASSPEGNDSVSDQIHDVPLFSYDEDHKIYSDRPGSSVTEEAPDTDSPATEETPDAESPQTEIASASDAIDAAKDKCTVEYDSTDVYFDPASKMWKVVFYREGFVGGCQTVYMNSHGTVMLNVYGE